MEQLPPSSNVPSSPKMGQTDPLTPIPSPANPVIITKAPPGRRPSGNTTSRPSSKKESKSSKSSRYYAGEIAVLTLSCVIFVGGLVAAISVACMRRKKQQHHRRRLSHFPAIPVEVRLQKQMPLRNIGGAPARPVIFPMALPTTSEPMLSTDTDNTSETFTDSPNMSPSRGQQCRNSNSCSNNNNGVCPECRKMRKPHSHGVRGAVQHHRDKNLIKSARNPRETSVHSNNDSGIDGSEGQCHCCQSHLNSSSESGRSVMQLTISL